MSKPDLRLYTPDTLDADVTGFYRPPSSPWADDGFGMVSVPHPATIPFRWPTDPKVPHTTGAPMDVLNRLEEVFARAKARNVSEADLGSLLLRMIHGPLAAALVKRTPTPLDDMALELLKALFPVAA